MALAAPRRVAIVGGGLSGLACANALHSLMDVSIWDMGKSGPGGRASTRRTEGNQFDHGCQFIQTTGEGLQTVLHDLEAAGAMAPWSPRIGLYNATEGQYTARARCVVARDGPGFCNSLLPGDLYVGTPGMNAICQHWASAKGLRAHWGKRVTSIRRGDDLMWQISATGPDMTEGSIAEGRGFDAVVLADIMTLQAGSPGYLGGMETGSAFAELQAVAPNPVFAMMATLSAPLLQVPFDAATVAGDRELQWICRDTSKPGRNRADGKECWVALTTAAFAEELIAERQLTENGQYVPQTPAYLASISTRLWDSFCRSLAPLLPQGAPTPLHLAAQRWGSGFKTNVLDSRYVWDPDTKLMACGDFCGDSSANGAIRSGLAAATALKKAFLVA